MQDNELIGLTADIVSAHVSHNNLAATDVPALIRSVYEALEKVGQPEAVSEEVTLVPAVSIRASVKPDYIVCLEDGKKLKMLKRYLRTNYNMSPEDYRAKWGLPKDYPMVAPSYRETRSTLAHQIGLGRKKVAETPPPVAKPKAVKAAAKVAAPKAAKVAEAKAPKAVKAAAKTAPAPIATEAPAKAAAKKAAPKKTKTAEADGASRKRLGIRTKAAAPAA